MGRFEAAPNLAQGWARLLVTALAASGARRWVVCPGSRSTPLALAAAADSTIEVVPVIDERAAAFVALGMARATGEPAVVLCTSGTAAAHLFPAIIEASEAGHPLIALTADRPWEAHGCGSSQTIDQTRLFGEHVRRFAALGVPEGTADALRAVARVASQMVAAALGPVRGPVHLDVPFRKPLEPQPSAVPEPWEAVAAAVTIPRAHPARVVASEAALASLARAVQRSRRGVLVAGPRPGAPATAEDLAAVRALAGATGFPVLAEATGGLRFGLGDACIGAFDAILRVPALADRLRPDLIVQLGWAPLSTAYAAWAQRAGCPVFVVGGQGWNDPAGIATEMIPGDPIDAVRALANRLERREPIDERAGGERRAGSPPGGRRADQGRIDERAGGERRAGSPPGGRRADQGRIDVAWRADFAVAEKNAWIAADANVASLPAGEGAAVRAALASVPEGGWILVGNSRPVRDLDSFVPPSPRFRTVLHQRGVAGIDGLVAGAAGASLATGRPGVLLLGDVSLSHDLSSLGIARDLRAPLAIVAIDNGGGRIFDELPVGKDASLAAERARLFTTPPRIDWANAAAAFGLAHELAKDATTLQKAIERAMERATATVVIAQVTPPPAGITPRESLYGAVRASLERGDG